MMLTYALNPLKTLGRIMAYFGEPVSSHQEEAADRWDWENNDPRVRLMADILEEELDRRGLALGMRREKRKIIIEVFSKKNFPADYQVITARTALCVKQGKWLIGYFLLEERLDQPAPLEEAFQ